MFYNIVFDLFNITTSHFFDIKIDRDVYISISIEQIHKFDLCNCSYSSIIPFRRPANFVVRVEAGDRKSARHFFGTPDFTIFDGGRVVRSTDSGVDIISTSTIKRNIIF